MKKTGEFKRTVDYACFVVFLLLSGHFRVLRRKLFMFSLFKRNKSKGKIRFVALPEIGWELDKSDKSVKQWMNPDQVMALSLHFFPSPPDIPTVHDIEMARKFYRHQITEAGGGLIQVDLIQVQGYSAVKTVFKLPQENGALTYLSSITIPFSDCSYVIKIQAPDLEATGKREAVVTNELLEKGVVTKDGSGILGWAQDPYLASHNKGTLMNQSEKELYDLDFPDHPLSLARTFLTKIEEGLTFDPQLGSLGRFKQ